MHDEQEVHAFYRRSHARTKERIRNQLFLLFFANTLAVAWGTHAVHGKRSHLLFTDPATTAETTTTLLTSGSKQRHRSSIWSSKLDDVPPKPQVDKAGTNNENSHSPAQIRSSTRQSTTSTSFDVTVLEAPSIAHENAVRYCMTLAESAWDSSQVVRVLVRFGSFLNSLGEDDYSTLGTGQPSRNWLINGIQMPMALAKAIENKNLNVKLSGNGNYDLLINLNTLPDWYLGIDGKTEPLTFDLVTVCLHEAYHGLLVSGNNINIEYDSELNTYLSHHVQPSKIGRFDQFMANQGDCNIDGYKHNETLLGDVLTSNNLYFVDATRTRIAKLHAPNPFIPGSSLYHLSESEYGASGDLNDLMTPIINMAYSQHNVGDVLLQIQERMMDLEYQPQAAMCENIGPPISVNNPVTQTGGGSGSDRMREDSFGEGFKLKIGNTEVSGWILVGAAVGVILLIIGILALRQCIQSQRRAQRPQRRTRRDEAVAKKHGGNEASIV